MRRAMRSRMSLLTAHRAFFDPLLVMVALENVLNEDARGDDVVGIDRAGLDDLLDLRNGDASGGCHHRIEVASRSPVYQIAEAVAFPGLHEREVGAERLLEHI